MKLLISFFLCIIFCHKSNSQNLDSVNIKCERIWNFYNAKLGTDTYHFVIVSFTFTNKSAKTRDFMTWDNWYYNISPMKKDFFCWRELFASNKEERIEPHSNYTSIKLMAIHEKYFIEKIIPFDFVWISREEYESSKYDKQVEIEKQKCLKLLKEHKHSTIPGEDYESMKFINLKRINTEYKRDLLIEEKIKSKKDLLHCELKL